MLELELEWARGCLQAGMRAGSPVFSRMASCAVLVFPSLWEEGLWGFERRNELGSLSGSWVEMGGSTV